MVHARYGSKDAILDAFFEHGYVQQVLPGPQPDATGMENAVAHFGRVLELHAQDRDFLRAMFVMTFEAVKTTSPVRSRLQAWFQRGVEAVEVGLRNGIADGSVRPDIDVDRAVNDISASAFGIAFHWIVMSEHYDLARELQYVRDRIVRDYGA